MQNPEVKTPPSLSNPMKTVSWPTPDGGTVASQTNISKKGVVRLELLSKANTVLHDSKGNFSFLSFWCLICSYPFTICCLVCTNITKISWNLCQQINEKKKMLLKHSDFFLYSWIIITCYCHCEYHPKVSIFCTSTP